MKCFASHVAAFNVTQASHSQNKDMDFGPLDNINHRIQWNYLANNQKLGKDDARNHDTTYDRLDVKQWSESSACWVS
jgi:hypothetical protein